MITAIQKSLVLQAEDRIWSKIKVTDECWLWTGTKDKKGYGKFWINGGKRAAHRIVYILIRGNLSNKFDIDHLCLNTSCVNPYHLEPVSHSENIKRAAFTRHKGNHEPRWSQWKNQRACLTCKNERIK